VSTLGRRSFSLSLHSGKHEEISKAVSPCADQQEFAGALAMTDGITDPKFPSDAAFADPAQWAAVVGGTAVLSFDEFSGIAGLDEFLLPGNHDDRTLVAVLPAPPPPLPRHEHRQSQIHHHRQGVSVRPEQARWQWCDEGCLFRT
jgi:hypothetical protein